VIFALGEGAIIFLAVLIACWIKLDVSIYRIDQTLLLKSFIITIICQMCLYYNDLYDFKIAINFKELAIRLLQALGITSIVFAILYFFLPWLIIAQGLFATVIGLVLLMVVTWRLGYVYVLANGLFDQKILLIGDGELAASIFKEIEEKRDSGYQIVQYINLATLTVQKSTLDAYPCHSGSETDIKKIVVALEEKRGKLPVKELLRCRTAGVEIIEGTSFYEMLMGKLYVTQINPAWLIFSDGFRKSRCQRVMKRTGDIVLSLVFLLLLLPLMLVTALLIKLDSKGSVLFSQERIGQHRKPFKIRKFRSMVAEAEKQTGPVWAKDDDVRITRVGKIIRKLRVDELPQIWNVLRGDMSFVGPRPEREYFVDELEKQIPYYGERFTVKPGITGWAQVSYGYGASIEDAIEKLNYDLFYIKNLSFLLDVMIIFRTIKIVLIGKGAR
jgi:sugar transferase (PEP-CTERM system associated)